MAARRLQAEIDRCLKKVSEGMEEFEIIYDKVMNAPTHAQKEKLETDLKKEIKKLQRCREQIKGWLATNEIKDKRELTETRKLIEKQMEKFKAVEKEMKTKAFSKEGLAQMTKIDPKDKERMEARQWLTESVDSLQTQIDLKEAEHEQIATQMNATGRRATGKKELAEKLKEIEHRIERHKWHVGRLERIMRLLENDGLTADEANAIREDIEYYVNSNDQDEFEEDDGIYENMNLDDDVDLYGIVDDYTTNNTNIHTESDTDHSDIDSPRQSASPLSNNILPLPIIAKPSQSKPTATLMKRSQTTAASIVSSSSISGGVTASVEPIGLERKTSVRDSNPGITANAAVATTVSAAGGLVSAATAALAEPVIRSQPVVATVPRTGPGDSLQGAWKLKGPAREVIVSPAPPAAQPIATTLAQTLPKTAEPSRAPSAAPQQQQQQQQQQQLSAVSPVSVAPIPAARSSTAAPSTSTISTGAVTAVVTTATAAAPAARSLSPSESKAKQQQQQQAQTTVASALTAAPAATSAKAADAKSAASQAKQAEVHQPTAASDIPSLLGLSAGSSSNAPSAFSEIVAAIRDTYALNPNAPLSTPNQRRQFFDASVQCIPDLLDGEHSTPYIPRNPADTPSYYPQLPPSSLKLSNRRLFERLNLETLFYIFYHQQDTPQQYLAAHELKKQSWRFHKQHATWFQRFNEPTTVTDEFEKGTYAYFDFEDGWRQRKRDGFCFEYKELEDSNLDLPKSANKTTTATAVAAAQ